MPWARRRTVWERGPAGRGPREPPRVSPNPLRRLANLTGDPQRMDDVRFRASAQAGSVDSIFGQQVRPGDDTSGFGGNRCHRALRYLRPCWCRGHHSQRVQGEVASKLEWARLQAAEDVPEQTLEQIHDLQEQVDRLTERVDFTEKLLDAGRALRSSQSHQLRESDEPVAALLQVRQDSRERRPVLDSARNLHME